MTIVKTCDLKFGTWTHDGNKINLTEADPSVDISSFQVLKYFSFIFNFYEIIRTMGSGN